MPRRTPFDHSIQLTRPKLAPATMLCQSKVETSWHPCQASLANHFLRLSPTQFTHNLCVPTSFTHLRSQTLARRLTPIAIQPRQLPSRSPEHAAQRR